MATKRKHRTDIKRISSLTAAILLVLLGLSVMAGWHFREIFLVRISAAFSPMAFNTALCFFLSGVSLFLLLLKKRKAAFSAAFFMASVAAVSAFERFSGLNLGVHSMFINVDRFHLQLEGVRMAGNTSAGFLLAGSSLMLAGTFWRGRFFTCGFLGAAVFALGFTSVFGYASGVERMYGAGNIGPMAIHTAAGFILLGGALLVFFWDRRNVYLPFAFTLCLGGMLSFQVFAALRHGEEQHILNILRIDAANRSAVLEREIETSVDLVRSLRAFFYSSEEVTLEEFSDFSREILSKQPHVRAIAWAPLIPAAGRSGLKNLYTGGPLPVVEMDPEGKMIPAAGREKYFPVTYVEPIRNNVPFLGFDLASNPRILHTMEKALEVNDVAASGRVDLSMGTRAGTFGFVLVDPVYGKKNPADGSRPEGFLSAAFVIGDLVQGAFRYLAPSGLDVLLVDMSAPPAERYLYFFPSPRYPDRPAPALDEMMNPAGPHFTFQISTAERKWKMICIPVEKHVQAQKTSLPWAGFFAILAGTLALSYYLWTNISRSRLIEETVHERTVELSRTNRNLSLEITIRQRYQEELTKTAMFQKAILESANVSIFSTDPAGTILSFNAATERMLGYGTEELVGKETPEKFHDAVEIRERAASLEAELGRPVKPGFEVFTVKPLMGLPEEHEWTFIRKDGSRIQVLLSISVLKDEKGGVKGFLGVAYDITDRRKALQALHESEERFREAFTYSATGMALIAPGGRWLQVNKAMEQITGYSMEELLKLDYRALTHNEDLGKEVPYVKRLLEGSITHYQLEKRYLHKQGHVIWVLVSVSLVREQGAPLYFIAQIQDISEMKHAEQEIRKKTEELARSNAELEQFAYVASHDLQEPLRKITAFGDLLKTEISRGVMDNVVPYVDRMSGAAVRMKRLIEDLLQYSRVGTRKAVLAPVELEAVVEDVVSDLEVRIKTTGAVIDKQVSGRVMGESYQLRQLFQNLIGNALKYVPSGTAPHIDIHSKRLNSGFIEVTIRDNGIGFDMKYADRIFAPFQRLHTRHEYEGTGIGLAICKKIMERHGGEIAVDSEPGKGSVFSLRLRAAPDGQA